MLGIVANSEVLKVAQDPHGRAGRRIRMAEDGADVWLRELSGERQWVLAVMNRGNRTQDLSVGWSELGLSERPEKVRDLWARQDLGRVPASRLSLQVEAHSTELLLVIDAR